MGNFPSLPEETNLHHLLRKYPNGIKGLLEYHDGILRSDGPMTLAERELLSAFVSAVNECEFCNNAHSMYAEMFGETQETVESLKLGVEKAKVSDKMRAALKFAEKLTRTPVKVNKDDAAAVLAAGWDERALNDIIHITALYNFMNRIALGAGLYPNNADFEERVGRLRQQDIETRKGFNQSHLNNHHYVTYGENIGVIDDDDEDDDDD